MALKVVKMLWHRLGELVNAYEKVLLAILSVVIVLSGTLWFKQFSITQTDQPTPGGTYVEGIVGGREEVEAIAAKVTKAGLFTVSRSGELVNLLVDSWTVNPEATQYKFILKDGVSGTEVQLALEENSDVIDQAAVTLEGRELTLTLPSPNPNLPLILTQPFFDYGPYKVSKITSKTTIFTRNTRPLAVSPYINKVIVHTFENYEALEKAIQKHQVDGGSLENQLLGNSDYSSQTLALPLYYALIFNINQAPFRDADFRRQVIDSRGPSSKTFRLTVADSEPYRQLAEGLITSWKAAGLQVTLDVRPLDEIQLKTAPTRDFQLLLTGISYASGLDPYYLWHSSQIRPPGNNLSGIKSAKIDTILGQIRSTNNVEERHNLINALHEVVKEEAVAVILKQETGDFLVSKNIHFVPPLLPISISDRWQSIALWWAR